LISSLMGAGNLGNTAAPADRGMEVVAVLLNRVPAGPEKS